MSKRKFKYTQRSPEANKKRSSQRGNKFASIFKPDLATFSTADDNRIRIFPAGWEGADHYGIDMFVHYSVGPDNQQFLCRKEMNMGRCPVCEERLSVLASDPDYAQKLKATHRVGVWVLDRNDRKAGPKLWAMPWTVDRDIAQLAQDEDSGEVLPLDHPDEGYDILFSMDGPKGGMKKYTGLKITRKSSPISKNEERQEEWLEFITENPVTDCLNFYSEEHIEGVFAAAGTDDDEDDKRVSRKSKTASKSKGRDKDEDEDEDEEDEDEEDERASRKSKGRSKLKGKSKRDEDEEDEDEDEKPAKSKKSGKKKRQRDEDEEEEEDSPFDDDDEDEKPKKSKKDKKSGKERRRDEDEDEDDDMDLDDLD